MANKTSKNQKVQKEKTITDDIEFPFNSPYDDLLMGKTLSKRGLWWTAVLLVKSKEKDTDDYDADKRNTTNKEGKTKIIIQRWQKRKRKSNENPEIETEFWMRKKDFTLSKVSQWTELKSIIDTWISNEQWKE